MYRILLFYGIIFLHLGFSYKPAKEKLLFFVQANNNGFPPQIIEFLGNQPITRVGRPFDVLATVSNPVTKKNIKSFNNEE